MHVPTRAKKDAVRNSAANQMMIDMAPELTLYETFRHTHESAAINPHRQSREKSVKDPRYQSSKQRQRQMENAAIKV
jgi:hypothetical protein